MCVYVYHCVLTVIVLKKLLTYLLTCYLKLYIRVMANSSVTSAKRIMTGVKRLDKVHNTTVLTSVSSNELIHTLHD